MSLCDAYFDDIVIGNNGLSGSLPLEIGSMESVEAFVLGSCFKVSRVKRLYWN